MISPTPVRKPGAILDRAPVLPRPSSKPAAVLTKVPAVLYARVSSRDQEKEGFSIPAQEKLLRAYAEDRGFRIEAEYVDIETAKKVGRLNFGKMVAWLRKNPACKSILVEKTDRLYRNLKDWVELDGMDLEIHLVKESIILSDSSRSHEKFIHGIKVLMAKNYIDNLSEEVKKGMLEKAEQGIFPGPAPIGYINAPRGDGKRIIEPDPAYSPSVVRMFELYATGTYTLKSLQQNLKDEGILSRRSKTAIGIPNIHITLRNPLYKGEFTWRGIWYQGSHKPLVSVETWDRVQAIMDGRGSTHPAVQRHNFAFNGLVACATCADFGERRLLVGEIQKKTYVYYHCAGCQRSGRKARFIKEELLFAMVGRQLARLQLDGVLMEWLKTGLRDSHLDEVRFHHAAVERLNKQQASLQRKLDLLYGDRLDERITLQAYEDKANGLREEMAHVRAELARHQVADRSYTEEGIGLLELAGKAFDLWESETAPEKRRLLDFMCLNSEFRDGLLIITWRKPFDVLAQSIEAAKGTGSAFDESGEARPEWWGRRDLNSQGLSSGRF